MKKRLLSLFCVFALLVGLMPTVAFAVDDTGQAIQFVDNGTAANIIGGQADSIYFGTYQQSSAGDTQPSGEEGVYWIKSDTATKNNVGPYYFIEPVKWLVLKNESNELFLLSDQILDRMEYNKVDGKIKWPQSTIRSWLNGLNENNGIGEGPIDYSSDNFLDTAFSDKEQAVIQSETIEEKNDNIALLSYTDFNNVPQDKKEPTVTDYSIGLGSNDTKWWIRPTSTYYGNGTYSMYVLTNFPVGNSTRLNYFYGVRPAFHLDLNSALFTSAAVGGKSSGAVGADALKQVEPYDGSEWKLTLKDDSRNSFSASVAAHSGNIAYIDYSGAAAGANEYISAIVTDSNNTIQYYGRIAKSTASDGSTGINVSSVPSGDTLWVFSEQYNGDKMTDYASNLVRVNLQGYENTPDAYGITNTLENLTNNNSAGYRLQSEGSDYTATLIPDSGYMLPETITVTVNNTSLTQGTDYTYDSETGQLTIMASAITGPIVITAAGIEKIYGISAVPTDLNFGSKTAGYPEAPTAQTVTITNTGNHILTVNLPGSTNYTVTEGTGFVNGVASLAPNGTATFTVQPITGLGVGSYRESLNISGSDGSKSVSAKVDLCFEVTQQTGGGGGSSGGSSTSTKTPSQQAIDKIENAKSGEVVEITLSTSNTKLDQEVFEKLAGRDVTLKISLPDGALWTVNGLDIPENADLSDLDLDVDMGTSSIPDAAFNAITGEVDTIPFTLKHNSEFGFPMTLTASLDKEYADLWANLYYYNTRTEELEFQSAHKIGANGTVGLPLTHGDQYAIVLDDRDHTPEAFPFEDVKESDWYYDAVDFVYQNELMSGTSTSRFDPNGTMNRAMLVTILHRQAGEPVVNYALLFDDVASGTWYTEAVRWAAAEGIVSGMTETAFAPDSSITREQFATILYRYAQQRGVDVSVGENTNILSYVDALAISEYAIPAMQWACGAGIVVGSGAHLNPQGQATRAEAATMLMRFIQTVA